ncbi:MAG: imidazoleglycerol-phosphate dehydratase [Alkaliphilus sp.]|nr:imidazoleglycerol-phosphate dehydratase HisB [bacterium AH-315-L21]PHS34856.1 MAG: imidazoleglycerol-phosphate dehydratase [Alkaliphilus sp.]
MSRQAKISRKTYETDISLSLNLDGQGLYDIKTGINFFDHMLEQLAKHSGMDLHINAQGDIEIDNHHTVEDVGICLGLAFQEAIGECRGIRRFGSTFMPMDETLTMIALDINGRPNAVMNMTFPSEKVGAFETECLREFLVAFANNAKITLHVDVRYGINTHHIIESIFKGIALCIKDGIKIVDSKVPSTKGRI